MCEGAKAEEDATRGADARIRHGMWRHVVTCDYMCIHENDNTHVMRITMKDLEAKLDPAKFQRVHRSTIVNLERVKKVCSHMNGEFYLQLHNDAAVKMSRSYKDKVKHFF